MAISSISYTSVQVESFRLRIQGSTQRAITPAPTSSVSSRVPPLAPPAQLPLPISEPRADDERIALLEMVEEAVKGSEAYQLLRHFIERSGHVDDDDAPARQSAPPAGFPPLPSGGVPAKPPLLAVSAVTTLKIEVNAVSYQQVVVQIAQPEPPQKSDPLALDLNGDGLQTTGIDDGRLFDINGDGVAERVSFITGGDAFLALDRNHNGRIDDGSELFGDQRGDAHGYAALARYDENGDGLIDHRDAVFNQLRLFSLDADGSEQLQTLQAQQIRAIAVGYQTSDIGLNQSDSITQRSSFIRNDGSLGLSGDLLLGFRSTA